jgi:hypothetical protein
MKFVGTSFDTGAEPTALDVPIANIVQQDVADPGVKIYVQFTGDPDPSSPVRGDVRIKQA